MKIRWTEEEIRLLLSYYARMKSGEMHKSHPLVIEASNAIRDLPNNKKYSDQSEIFRNPNGVALKLANFLFLDPKYSGLGMKGCSELDRLIFNQVNSTSSLKTIIMEFLSVLKDIGAKGDGMGRQNHFNELANQLKISYAGSKILPAESRYLNTSPIISFGLGRFTHVPWIVFTNYDQKVKSGIYPALLFYTEEQKIILTYCVSESNVSSFGWNENFIKGLPLIKDILPNTDKYLSSYVYKTYDIPNDYHEINIEELILNLQKVIEDFHEQFKDNSKLLKNNIQMTTDKFPFRFKTWLSSNEGGVRKPMDESSGRPLENEIIESKIHGLIRTMVSDYVTTCSRSVCVLVGGPGNGKTDLMEFATECFLDEIGYNKTDGKEEIKKKFEENNRKATFSHENYNLLLTQDASQRDDNSANYVEALANDFSDLMRLDSSLSIICINRGILENLKNSATIPDFSVFQYADIINKIYELNNIEAIIQNKTVWGNNEIQSVRLYTWSMDYDSLFADQNKDLNIIKRIIEKSKCLSNFDHFSSEFHPSKCSLDFLGNDENNFNLSKLLRCIEVLNGKRFTYREIFSLIAYLFGISKDDGSQIESKVQDYDRINSDDLISQFQILFNLYRFTPNYRFFNYFLSANAELIKKCIQAYNPKDTKDLTVFFNTIVRNKNNSSSGIPKFIQNEEVNYFDPLFYEQNDFEFEDKLGNPIKLKSIIDKVNYNDSLHIENYSNIFNPLDQKLIKCLEDIKQKYCLEKDYHNFNSQQLNSLETFKGFLNSLMIAVIKRGLLFTKFFIREKDNIEYFIELTNPKYTSEFLIDFKNAISKNGKIQNSLSTSIGQTSDQVKHNVYSEFEIEKLRCIDERKYDLPSTDQIFFKYESKGNWKFIVITYLIYKNIRLHSESIFPACLDKNFHLWNDLKKIELSDKDSTSTDVYVSEIGTIRQNRASKVYQLI